MHIGLIPDGNRRYMKKRGIVNLMSSYINGINKFYDFLDWSMKRGVNEVTIYALSIENIKNRGKQEVETLYRAFTEQAKSALKDRKIHEKQIRIHVCGDKQSLLENGDRKLAEEMIKTMEDLEKSTEGYNKFTLNFAVGYGGRQEIINAVRNLNSRGLEVNEENIRKNLWVKDYPDIVIRTSEERLSNFLTWQSAYSEIYFVDKLWQEFGENDLEKIIEDYSSRDRRFGK